ncbi:MAG: glycosyltransferase family 4 protein [Candidatus Eisenbacteria bacterium]
MSASSPAERVAPGALPVELPLAARPLSAGPRIPVVLIESGQSVGGTEKVVFELACRLDRARFSTSVALAPSPALDRIAADLERAGVPVERLPEMTNRFQLGRALQTLGFLRRSRRSILHVHHVWPAADRYLVPMAHLVGVPAVLVTEHLVGYAHSGGQRWLKRWELSRADQVVCVSRAVADGLARDYGFDVEGNGRVIENGVDAVGLDRMQERAADERLRVRARLGAAPGELVWLFVGRLETQKGVDVLLDAFALAGAGAWLWIVGDGSMRAELEAHARALGVLERVRFEGAVADAAPFYWGADAFAIASRWEGLPLALLEAQAAGLPVVAAAAGGVAEAIREGTSGLLVPREDPAALAFAMRRIAEEPELARRLGYEAARQAREEWSWERMVSAYEVLYERAWKQTMGRVPREGSR